MFNKKIKKKISKDQLERHNAIKAHEEMVLKSGGGINFLFQVIENNNYNEEMFKQKIIRLNREITNLENELNELTEIYKFKNNLYSLFNLYNLYKKLYIKIQYKFSIIKIFKLFVILMNLLFFINNFYNII